MNEPTAVCGWCGKNVASRGDGAFRSHLGATDKWCRGSGEYPNDTVIQAAAERLRDAAPRLLESLTELCDALDAGADSVIIGGLKNQARFAVAAATVRPTT